VKQLIHSVKFRHLQIRVFKGDEDDFDLVFTSGDYPYFRVQYRDLDRMSLDHVYTPLKNRAWLMQWLPPRWCHFLVIGT
jgi:hypothetical protein